MSLHALALKAGLPSMTLFSWVKNKTIPRAASAKSIHNLETYFQLPFGTLTSRLPDALWMDKKYQTKMTVWRRHMSDITKLTYALKNYPLRAEKEWNELVLFYTDPRWADDQGLEKNSAWRTRWNNGICATADIRKSMVSSFFGYCL
jgi:hypothetical protein